MESVKNAIAFTVKSFAAGCFGCLGVGFAVVVLVAVVGLVAGPAIVSFVQGIQLPQLPIGPAGLPSGPTGAPTGPGGIVTPPPTPTGELPKLTVWLTKGDKPDSERVTTMKSGAKDGPHIWAQGPKGVTVSLQLWLTWPDGKREPFGPLFKTDPEGKPVGCGGFAGSPPSAGNFKLEALIGETVVGSTTFTVAP
jgi:hypothetical protein